MQYTSGVARALLMFSRNLERDRVGAGVPPEQGSPVFQRHVAAWIAAAVACDATPVIACCAEDRETLQAIVPEQSRLWVTQRGRAYGQRLAIAATDAFSLGFNSLVIAAIDAPPPRRLDHAFETIESGVNIVAPSADGGVNLLGLRATDVDRLTSIQVRQHDLVATLRNRFSKLVVLPSAAEIDDVAALDDAIGTQVGHEIAPAVSLRSGMVADDAS